MTLSRAGVLIFATVLGLTAVVAVVARATYPAFLRANPGAPEYEIQFWFASVAIVVLMSTVVYVGSWASPIGRALDRAGTTSIPSVTLVITAACLAFYLVYFTESDFQSPGFLSSLPDFGISPPAEPPRLGLFITVILLTIWFGLIAYGRVPRVPEPVSLLMGSAIGVIAVIGFQPKNFYDYGYYAGPINDLLHGKYLLNNIQSQYGMLSMLTLSVPFHFWNLNIQTLSLINSISVGLGLIAVFAICRTLFRSELYALFVFVVAVFVNYLVQIGEIGFYPQTNMLRFGAWIPIAMLISCELRAKNDRSARIWRLASFVLLGPALLWNLDSGIYVVIAFLAFRYSERMLSGSIRELSKFAIDVVGAIVSIAAAVAVVIVVYGILGISIDWGLFGLDASYYLSGFGMLPLPASSWHWYVIAIYATTYAYWIATRRLRTPVGIDRKNELIVFILFYGVCQFAYFMGRSHLNNLHHVAIPFVLCLGYLLGELLDSGAKRYARLWRPLTALNLGLILALPVYFIGMQGLHNLSAVRRSTIVSSLESVRSGEPQHPLGSTGLSTIAAIQKRYGAYIAEHGITLVSEHDVWYLVALGVSNNIQISNLQYFTRKSDYEAAKREILSRKDPMIFVDRDEGERSQYLFASVKDLYVPIDNVGEIDVYERRDERVKVPSEAGSSVELVSVTNPNGVEQHNGQAFYWIGPSPLCLNLRATRAGNVDVAFVAQPGPSLPETTQRNLVASIARSWSSEFTIREYPDVKISVPVGEGGNRVCMLVKDKPTVVPSATGDQRILLLGVRAITVKMRDQS